MRALYFQINIYIQQESKHTTGTCFKTMLQIVKVHSSIHGRVVMTYTNHVPFEAKP